MKLSKTSWIFLIAGVFLILGISLVMTRIQQTDEQNKLQESLRQANVKLAQIKLDELTAQKEKLASQIADYDTRIASTRTLLNYSKDSIDTTGIILNEARQQGVDLIELSSPGVAKEMLDGNPCETLALNLKVKGSISHISDFIYGLSKTFPTGVIKSVEMDVQTPKADEPEDVPAETAQPAPPPTLTTFAEDLSEDTTVNINLMIYNFKGKE